MAADYSHGEILQLMDRAIEIIKNIPMTPPDLVTSKIDQFKRVLQALQEEYERLAETGKA